MRFSIPNFRSALLGATLALVLGPAASEAQSIDPNRLDRPDLKLLSPAELEIRGARVYDDNRDGRIGAKETLTLMVMVRNNGELSGSFDYALGPSNQSAVWWTQDGTSLSAGRDHWARFDVGWQALTNRLGTARGEGYQRVCLAVWLLKGNQSIGWTDADNPNHKETVCFELYRVPT